MEIDPIVQLAASAIPGKKKYVLLIGAGVSRDAGLPTAWDLTLEIAKLIYASINPEDELPDDIENWFINSEYSNRKFSEYMEEFFPQQGDLKDFLNLHLSKTPTKYVYKYVSELVKRGYIRAIITTNFDNYTEKALEREGIDYNVIVTKEDVKSAEPLIQTDKFRIYKPHGDLNRGKIKVSPQDLKKLEKNMEKELIDICDKHGLIVLGYAGEDEGIQKILQKRTRNYYSIYWSYFDNLPGEPIKKIVENQGKFIEGGTASEFLKKFLNSSQMLIQISSTPEITPSIEEMESALKVSNSLFGMLVRDFLNNLFLTIKFTKPNYNSSNPENQEIIDKNLEQMNKCIPLIYKLYQVIRLICVKNNRLLHFKLMDFYSDLVSYSRSVPNKDSLCLIIYEMFVGHVAIMLNYKSNYEEAKILNSFLSRKIYIDSLDEYVSLTHLQIPPNQPFIHDRGGFVTRNYEDYIKNHFTSSLLKDIVNHIEFMEADYFIFLFCMCNSQNLHLGDNTINLNVWSPESCKNMDFIPSYLQKIQDVENKEYIIMGIYGQMDTDVFVETFKREYEIFSELWFDYHDNPLIRYRFDKLDNI